jgi:hypothetical protein
LPKLLSERCVSKSMFDYGAIPGDHSNVAGQHFPHERIPGEHKGLPS